jgi:hypothetical protein
LTFVWIVALPDSVVVAGLVQRSLVLFGSVLGFWVPLALIVGVTWAAGECLSMMPRTLAMLAETQRRIA